MHSIVGSLFAYIVCSHCTYLCGCGYRGNFVGEVVCIPSELATGDYKIINYYSTDTCMHCFLVHAHVQNLNCAMGF